MTSPSKPAEPIVVLDKSSRRRFIRASGGVLIAGATAAVSPSVLAADCDRGGEQNSASDQDSGEQSDPKGCQSKNIISKHQPERITPVTVKTIKA